MIDKRKINNYDFNKAFNFFDYWKNFTQPTEFYNEGWLTRLLIFSITNHGIKRHDLYIKTNYEYFSEPLLYSPFLARTKKDPLAESFTHADSAIGEFKIGNNKNKGILELQGNDLKIIEAKINSEFSGGVTNAKFYNQSARYIACITETIDKAKKFNVLNDLTLGFYLTVPEKQFELKNSFKSALNKDYIFETVEKRVEQYKGEKEYNQKKLWLETKFRPVLEKIIIKPIFYEKIILELQEYKFVDKISAYYKMCLDYNK